jgi:hypothetical protein
LIPLEREKIRGRANNLGADLLSKIRRGSLFRLPLRALELIGDLPSPLLNCPKDASEKICEERKQRIFCGESLM